MSKSDDHTPAGLDRLLARSLERMKTDRIDLYYLHMVKQISALSPAVRAWADKAKKAGKIRYFGFSCHDNVVPLLSGASKLAFIDGMMVKCDYGLMQQDDMKRALAAAGEAGIGLTAMKIKRGGVVRADEDEANLTLAARLVQKGYTPDQAKMKAVLANPHITSACMKMNNTELLTSFVAAALDRTRLSEGDFEALDRYVRATEGATCAGCSARCEAAVDGRVPVADVMRFLMYDRSYGERARARAEFARLPAEARAALPLIDYAAAEARCPQGLPIARLMREASVELA